MLFIQTHVYIHTYIESIQSSYYLTDIIVRCLNSSFVNNISANISIEVPKRISPFQDAKFWCDIGLDKDGFERKFISDEIGEHLTIIHTS